MERKEFITIVWSSSLIEPLFMDDIPDEEINDELEERKQNFET